MDTRKQKPNAVGRARKAWAFTSVFAAMGSLAGQFSFWKPQTFKGAKPMRPAPGRPAPDRKPLSPEHVAAVALMRAARRLKGMAKAEDELSEKRRRQAAQLRRHAHCIARRTKRLPLRPPHAVIPAPHFL